jgi:hypothetical protein
MDEIDGAAWWANFKSLPKEEQDKIIKEQEKKRHTEALEQMAAFLESEGYLVERPLEYKIISAEEKDVIRKAILNRMKAIQETKGEIDVNNFIGFEAPAIADELWTRRVIDDMIYKGELYIIRPNFAKVTQKEQTDDGGKIWQT